MPTQRSFFILMGPPGSGKGTLSRLLVNKHGWIQMSTGNLCRKHIDEGSEIGRRIDFALKSGKLIDDRLITKLVMEWVNQQPKSAWIILDGYPRTVTQAQAFDDVVSHELQSSAALNIVRLKISDGVVIERLGRRLVCGNKDCQAVYSAVGASSLAPKNDAMCDACGAHVERRIDDDLETITQRLKTYYEHEKTLLDFYKTRGHQVKMLDVNKDVSGILLDFEKLIRAERHL